MQSCNRNFIYPNHKIGPIATTEHSDHRSGHYAMWSPLFRADSANASAISQLALTRVTDVSIYPVFDAIRLMEAFR